MKAFKLQHMKSFAILTSNMLNGMIFKLLLLVAVLNIVLVHSQFRGDRSQEYEGAGNQFRGYHQQPHPNQGFEQQQKKKPDIIPANFFNSLGHDGSRNFGYQTADGQQRTETTDADGTVRGSYSYMGPDGKEVKINYVADKNGFQASGPTIPKPPPAAAATAHDGGGKGHGHGGKQQDYDYDDGSSHEDNFRGHGSNNGGGGGHHHGDGGGGHHHGGGGGGHHHGGGGNGGDGGQHHGGGGGHFNFAPQNFQEQHHPHFGSANQHNHQQQQQGFQPNFGFGGGRGDENDYDGGFSGSHRQEFGGGFGGQSQGSQIAPRQVNHNRNFNRFVDNSQF